MKNPNNLAFIVLLNTLLFCPPLYSAIKERVDPTRPPGFNAVPKGLTTYAPLVVTAIFIYPQKRLAIINGKTMQVGDKIGELTITAIDPNAVELKSMGNAIEILQLTYSVKKPAKLIYSKGNE